MNKNINLLVGQHIQVESHSRSAKPYRVDSGEHRNQACRDFVVYFSQVLRYEHGLAPDSCRRMLVYQNSRQVYKTVQSFEAGSNRSHVQQWGKRILHMESARRQVVQRCSTFQSDTKPHDACSNILTKLLLNALFLYC